MPDPLSVAEPINNAISLLELYQTQYTQTDKLWGYFGTVTLAIIAFSLGSEKATKTMKEASIVIAGYVVFCFGNYSALSKAQEQLIEFATHASDAANAAGIPFKHLAPFDLAWLSGFYWCVVAAVSIGIVLISRWRSK